MNLHINLDLYDLCPAQVFIKLLDNGYTHKLSFDNQGDILDFAYVISAYTHICNLIGGL